MGSGCQGDRAVKGLSEKQPERKRYTSREEERERGIERYRICFH